MKIKEVYTAYRAGGLEVGGKFQFKSFYQFPVIEDELISFGDDRLKEENISPEAKKEWREKVWIDKKLVFKKTKIDDYKTFFKTYKKVFDMKVELEEPIQVNKYKDLYELTDEVVIQQVGSAKVKDLVGALSDYEIPLQKGKDRAGNEAIVPEYDYEDNAVALLKDKAFSFTVVGEGLDTKYTYKEKPFLQKETKEGVNEFGDLPF